MDDVPPPPYSETDIYSTSGQRSNPSSNSPHVPSHHGDEAASRGSSHASSHSEVIYTPPLTPRTSGAGGPHHHDSNPSLASRPQAVAAPSTSAAYSDFAAAYFESRPAPAFSPRDQLVHSLTVTPSSTPDDVPCPPTWAARDVTQQDWATFTNCLIPHHTAARNEAVINRKLQAEEAAIAAAAAASNGGRGDTSSTSARSNSSSHASAQLDQIRSDPDTDPGAAAAASGLRREDVEAVVAQWNEGFFRPRAVAVMLNPEVEELRVPGGWDRSFDRSVESPTVPGGGGSGGPTPVPFPVHTGQGPAMQPGPSSSEARSSWSFGGITVTTDGISIGDRIVADSNGIRVGNLIADENGIRFGSNTTPRAQPHYVGPNPNWAPPLSHAPPGPSPVPMFGPGPGPGPFPPGPHPQPMAHSGPHEHPFFPGGHSHAHVRHGSGSGGRGRPPGRYPSDQRSVSASSSASSSSSSSSTSSASSVGSLPDYEDLYPAQLPIYKQRVASWLSHPDQPVTKADIAQLRKEMRAAHSASGASEQAKQHDPSAAAAPSKADEKALKAELKALTQEWRKLKRQQRTVRKEKRRERRARRREEKRERREQRRERREQRREGRREQRATRRGGGGDSDGGPRGDHQHHHQHHQHHHHQHHQHHGPGPMPAPSLWGTPQPFVPPPPPHGVHVPPPPVIHTPPVPVVPGVSPNVPNNFQWASGPGRGFAPPGGFPGGGGPWGAGFGRSWGRGHGPGGEHAFPFNAGPPPPPGAWPVGGGGGGGDGSPGASTPPVPPSQVLFKAVEEMEKDIARRVEELDKARNEMRDNNPRRGRCGNSRGRGRCGGGRAGRGDETAQRMEEEIDELSRNVEKLKIEADAEFARELAAEDDKSSGW
ncbi:hypothetical protein ColTof3_07467 [Colletotrichum tofieldiae]|nr:hypothetical protein ColTof3_07467 [Colletotrichum tofieldiae]